MKFEDMMISNAKINLSQVFFDFCGAQTADYEEARKRSVMAIYLVIGIVVIFPFAVHHFLLGNTARAILLLLVGSIQIFSLFALRLSYRSTGIFRLNVLLLGGYFLFLVNIGGHHGSRILWILMFPLLTFFLLGKKEGLLWCAIHFLLALVLIADPGSAFDTFPYEEEIKSRFYVVYGIIVMMSYVVEATRQRYYTGMEQNQIRLETEIEDRRRAEEIAVAESSFRKAIIEHAAEGLCVCHATEAFPYLKFTVWNDRMTEITGYTMSEINRLGWYQKLYPDHDLQMKAKERMNRMRAGDNLVDEEWEIVRRDGGRALLSISTSLLVTRDGAEHALALMQDVTVRKQAETDIRDLTAFFSVLATIRGVAEDESDSTLWQSFLSALVGQYGFLAVWYGSYTHQRVVPVYTAGRLDHYLDDLVLDIREPTSADAQCAMSRAILGGEAFGYADLAHDAGFRRWRNYALELGYRSNMALPLVAAGRTEGGVMMYAGTTDAFPRERVDRLDLLMSEMGNALVERRRARQAKADLQKAYDDLEKRVSDRTAELRRANEKLRIEIEERQSAEEELRGSERRLGDIINFLPDATFVVDQNGKVIAWNQAIEELTGIPAEKMLGRGDYEYGIPFYGTRRPTMIDLALNWNDDAADTYEYVKRVGSSLVSETRNPPFRKDPSLFWNTARPLYDADGKIAGAIEVIRDLTERMLAEEALKAAEREKEIILSSLMEFVIYQDLDMNILWANQAACESAGLRRDEILGSHCYDIWADEGKGRPCPDCPVRKAMDTGEAQVTERIAADGTAWILRGYPVRNSANEIIGGIEVALDITERKRAEAALHEAYNILNLSPAVAFLWQNTDGWPVQFVTDNVEDLFGYDADEFLNQHINYAKTIHPDDLQRVMKEVEEFSAEAGRLTFRHQPYRIITADHTVKWVDDRTYIRRNENDAISHYQGIVMDITDQMLMEAALRESEERFRELAENIRDVFWLFDWSNQQLLYVSPAYEEVWGRPIQNMSNGYREWAASIHSEDAEFVRESFLDIIRTGGGEPRTYRIHRPDGTMRWIMDRGFAIKDEDGKVKHIAGVAEDITDQKLAEEELGRHREKLEELIEERTRELAAAQDELLKSERLSVLGQLTATVSHELRNPLGVIRSSLYYLQQKYQGQDAKIKKHMGRIEDQVETCNMIVGDLLDYTRGRHSQTVEGEINVWLERVLDEIEEGTDIAVRRLLGGKTLKASFDSEKLRRVVINLIENALQAVREREQVSASRSYRPEVKVSSKAVEGGVCLQVRDNGVGMDRQSLQRAIEPLFTTKARGTGLGLAVVQKIIDEHGGTLSIQSHLNTGTEVTIILPGSGSSITDD